MDNAITNPLYGVETGSTVHPESGSLRFGFTVLNSALTEMKADSSQIMSMTGNSDYLYTDSMNQGSLAVSGSYGASGLAKVSGAVTAYVGNTRSESSKTLSITLNCVQAAGIECIDFDSLLLDNIIAGLKPNVMSDVKDVLEKYTAVKNPAHWDSPAMQAWRAAVDAFTKDHGSGIVIATLWGGYASAVLTFTTGSTSDKWVYGGSAEFSYAGTGANVAVSATYGGSKQTLGTGATVDVTVHGNGKCVAELATAWGAQLTALAQKGLDTVGSTVVTAPTLSTQVTPPKLPDLVTPKKDKGVAELITGITDLKGLEAYAQASAYDDYKKGGGKKDLAGFLADAKLDNDFNALEKKLDAASSVLDSASGSARDGADNIAVAASHRGAKSAPRETPPAGPAPAAAPRADFSAYEPLGIWIANWSQLFPWLVSGHSNQVTSDTPEIQMIGLRRMQQDFLTLSKLYRRFANLASSYKEFYVKPMTDRITFDALANDFANGAAKVSDFIRGVITGQGASNRSPREEMDDRIAGLSRYASVIYRAWDHPLGFLRNAELGLGITVDAPGQPTLSIAAFGVNDDWKGNGCEMQTPRLQSCAFEPNRKNYNVFATFVKGWPLLYVGGDNMDQVGVACYVEGKQKENCGLLAYDPRWSTNNLKLYVWHGFEPNMQGGGKCLLNVHIPVVNDPAGQEHLATPFEIPNKSDGQIRLWPIPYEAAKGSPWFGQSMATGDGAMGEQLAAVAKALGAMRQWSFDSDHWKGRNLGGGRVSMQTINPYYVGLIPEPDHIAWG